MLSIIIPSYNEHENIKNTAAVLETLLLHHRIAYELLFVDDGSRDDTWKYICEEAERSEHIRGIRFSRNFGKEGAIFAGLEACLGDAAVVIDCDLQHPPETIIEMHRLWQCEGADVVEGKKSARGKENALYGAFSKLFYRFIKKVSKLDMLDTSDFKLLDRKVINALLALPERITFFRALSGWVGFNTKTVYYEVQERKYGTRKWTLGMLLGYAIRNLSSFTGAPLYISTILGLLVNLSAFVLLVLFLCGINLGSFSLGVIILMFVGGCILQSLGISSYYVSRIYEEIKQRPRYIVWQETPKKEQQNG